MRPLSYERSRVYPRGDLEGDLVKLFQGCTGSGDLAMKNARDRYDIASEMNILCYEMKVTSAMDSVSSSHPRDFGLRGQTQK